MSTTPKFASSQSHERKPTSPQHDEHQRHPGQPKPATPERKPTTPEREDQRGHDHDRNAPHKK